MRNSPSTLRARDSEAQGVTVLRVPSTPLGVSREEQQASGLLRNAIGVKPLWILSGTIMIYLHAILVLSILGGLLSVLLLIATRYLAYYGPCTIKINEEKPFEIEGGCKLLDALYDRKIFIPSACGGQGTCGFCKVKVLEGGGPVLPTELPYLTKEEISAQARLACQVKVKQDLDVHVRPDYLNIKEFTAKVTSVRMVTHDTREIIIKLIEPDKIEFKPGQYVQVNVPGTKETTFRAYSISSPPEKKNEIELLIRLIPGGLGSTYLHNVKVDEEMNLTGPYGEFVMDKESELICVGGGCGLAPMRSIIRHAKKISPKREAWLFFGARTDDDVMYIDEFKKLQKEMPGLHIHYALSEPKKSSDWKGETGFIHESVDKHISKKDKDAKRQIFLCGPPLMIKAVRKVLKEKGVPRKKIFFDEF